MDASKTYSFSVAEKGHRLSIGGGSTSMPFKGKIDHVAVYDRVLSVDEILGLFEEAQ